MYALICNRLIAVKVSLNIRHSFSVLPLSHPMILQSYTQVVSDCVTPEAGEYACHALGSLSAESFENSNLMIQVLELCFKGCSIVTTNMI